MEKFLKVLLARCAAVEEPKVAKEEKAKRR